MSCEFSMHLHRQKAQIVEVEFMHRALKAHSAVRT